MKWCHYLMLPCIISACKPMRPVENGGCYSDSREARILPELVSGADNDLTIRECVRRCRDSGFSLAGLQVGTECWCGNEPPVEPTAPEYQCQSKCSGNADQICGDFFRNNIYLTDTGALAENGGCYVDTAEKRILPKLISGANNGLTIGECVELCKNAGWLLAGVQVGTQCWCGNNQLPIPPTAPENECNFPCKGNPEQICGDVFRNNVYPTDTGALAENGGCYVDSAEKRILPVLIRGANNDLTIGDCVELCRNAGWLLAGVQIGTQCWCGNDKLPKPPTAPQKECNSDCSGNPDQTCGGFFRNNVYLTNTG